MNESICVSALNRYVKLLLETDEVLSQIWVEGEISGLVAHSRSGHLYFTLKDAAASVKAVMFRSYAARLRFIPQNGMQIAARCRVSLYERDGAFQLYVEDILPKGAGDAAAQLRRLSEKLEREGLFAPERKRPLPAFPRRIAVVTSESGAAIRDVQSVASRRWPFARLELYPVNVQGMFAVEGILDAFRRIAAQPGIDEVLLTRGGGSKEDLWIFNDESLVRAAAALPQPLVSAVGHEIDVTLVDCVADLRAATPSAAAELMLPDAAAMLASARVGLAEMKAGLLRLVGEGQTRLAACAEPLRAFAAAPFAGQQQRLEHAAAYCDALSPLKVVLRGYTVAMLQSGRVLSSVEGVAAGDKLGLRLRDGRLHCTVDRVEKEELQNGL